MLLNADNNRAGDSYCALKGNRVTTALIYTLSALKHACLCKYVPHIT